jgi:hypothetical protein
MGTRDSIGELVTQHAEDIATRDKVAQQLGRAVGRAMSPVWRGGRFEVDATANLACDWYEVRITEQGAWRGEQQLYVVYEEALARNTTSVTAFQGWVHAAASRLVTMFRREPAAAPAEDANAFLAAAKARAEHHALLERTLEELEDLGFRRRDEKAEAIESIKRSLNARPEQ